METLDFSKFWVYNAGVFGKRTVFRFEKSIDFGVKKGGAKLCMLMKKRF
ncbi:MAG: hypothetical protein IJW64_02055 [Clostridia bacterium]|nr:hypothetical protein [Clostridia bacterium]